MELRNPPSRQPIRLLFRPPSYMPRDGSEYRDLGADHSNRRDRFKVISRLVRRLTDLGCQVEFKHVGLPTRWPLARVAAISVAYFGSHHLDIPVAKEAWQNTQPPWLHRTDFSQGEYALNSAEPSYQLPRHYHKSHYPVQPEVLVPLHTVPTPPEGQPLYVQFAATSGRAIQ
jgi:hypothetical protein